jgi:hypothetical protein
MPPVIRGKLKKCGYRRTGEEVMTEEDAEGRLLKKVTRRKQMPPDTAAVMMMRLTGLSRHRMRR